VLGGHDLHPVTEHLRMLDDPFLQVDGLMNAQMG
jgi:hypothetical protein